MPFFICAVISSQNHKRTSVHVFLSVLLPLWTQLLFVFRRSCLFTRVQRRNMQRRYWTSWTRRENCLGKSPRDLLPLVCRGRLCSATETSAASDLLHSACECLPAAGRSCDLLTTGHRSVCSWLDDQLVTLVKMSLNWRRRMRPTSRSNEHKIRQKAGFRLHQKKLSDCFL